MMRHICDQIRLHPFAFYTFIYRPVQSLADIVNIIGKFQKYAGTHILCIDLIVQMARSDLPGAFGNILDSHKLSPYINKFTAVNTNNQEQKHHGTGRKNKSHQNKVCNAKTQDHGNIFAHQVIIDHTLVDHHIGSVKQPVDQRLAEEIMGFSPPRQAVDTGHGGSVGRNHHNGGAQDFSHRAPVNGPSHKHDHSDPKKSKNAKHNTCGNLRIYFVQPQDPYLAFSPAPSGR